MKKTIHIIKSNFLVFVLIFFFALATSSSRDQTIILNPEDGFILPNQKTIKVSLDTLNPPAYLKPNQAEQAIRNAVDKWNNSLGGKLNIMVENIGSTVPQNEVFIRIQFSSNSSLFKQSGNELGYTTFHVERVRRIAEVLIFLNDTPAMKNMFSTNGAIDATYDLELVAMHELGHAIGVDHDSSASHYPPVMSPRLGNNLEINQWTKKNITDLRKLYPKDDQLLQKALQKRDQYDFAGIYEGTLTYTKMKKENEASYTTINRNVTFSNFKIEQTNSKVILTFQGNKLDAYGGSSLLLLEGKPIRLEKIDGWIEWAEIIKDPQGLKVTLERIVEPGRKLYQAEGYLTKMVP